MLKTSLTNLNPCKKHAHLSVTNTDRTLTALDVGDVPPSGSPAVGPRSAAAAVGPCRCPGVPCRFWCSPLGAGKGELEAFGTAPRNTKADEDSEPTFGEQSTPVLFQLVVPASFLTTQILKCFAAFELLQRDGMWSFNQSGKSLPCAMARNNGLTFASLYIAF